MNINVEDYIGELATKAWNLGYDFELDSYNNIVFFQHGNYWAPEIHGKFMTDNESFWFNPSMKFVKKEISFEEGSRDSFKWITKEWYNSSSIAEYMLNHEWKY